MPSQELEPKDWIEEIEAGLEYRRRFGLEEQWGTLESIYYNVHESMTNDGPNILLSNGDTLLSMLSVPAPFVAIKPTNPESVSRAPLLQTLDNTLFEDLNVPEEAETASLHAFLFGRGVLKIGYDSEWGYDPRYDVGGNLSLGLTLTQVDRKGRRLIEYDSTVVPGMPWCRAVDPRDIIVPWGTRELRTTPWIAQRVVRHIDDLKADPKYENKSKLMGQLSMQDFVDSYRTVINKDTKRLMAQGDAEFVEFFEIHDRRTGRIYCVTWDHDRYLRNQSNALQIDNQLPFASLAFIPRTRAFWTTPDAYYLLFAQMELSDVAVQRTKQRRISVLKFLYDKGAITPEELQKILSPTVGAAAGVEQGNDISKAIITLQATQNQSLQIEEELLRSNAREQMGFSRNQLGEYTGGRKTASEVGAVERSAMLRMSRRGKIIKRLYEDTIRLINGMIFQHWTLPRAVRILGPEQGEQWIQLNGPGLRGRYNYKVELIDEEEAKAAEIDALRLYSMMSQDPGVDPVALREYLIHRFNNPQFARIFSAPLRMEMLQRQLSSGGQGGGGVQSSGGTQRRPQQAQLPTVQGTNGQALTSITP